MQELLKALISAKAEFSAIKKDKVNPHFKNKYASLDAVLAAVEPALSKHGLAIVHSVAGDKFITTIYHESGSSLVSELPLPAFSDPQKMGSYLSYCRRYAICGLLSVTADEDDDGHQAKPGIVAVSPAALAATAKHSSRQMKPIPVAAPMPAGDDSTQDQQSEVVYLFERLGWDNSQKSAWNRAKMGGKRSADWSPEDWQKAISLLYGELDQKVMGVS